MTLRSVGTLEAVRRILSHLVLRGGTVRVVAPVPDGPTTVAVHPPGVLTPQLRVLMARPLVRKELAAYMAIGTAKYAQGTPDMHSRAATAAGFAAIQRALLTFDQRELFEERAAIREFEGGQTRPQAELFALFDVLECSSMIEAVAALAVA